MIPQPRRRLTAQRRCVWTLTEIFYTYKQVEWSKIGPIHVGLCLIVLGFSIAAKVTYHNWTLTV